MTVKFKKMMVNAVKFEKKQIKSSITIKFIKMSEKRVELKKEWRKRLLDLKKTMGVTNKF